MLIVNLNQDYSKANKYLSNTLLKHITTNLQNNKKVMLYLNKRGNYTSLICKSCHTISKCKNCDVSLTIHGEMMVCHLCGYRKKIPISCKNCDSEALEKIGIGTAQIEASLRNLYPETVIFRLDTDNVKNKTEKQSAVAHIDTADIIIGTKMITTGFDFKNIGLIGVILLEQELMGTAYNSEENLYSNIKQLLGRGARKGEQTDFILQTFVPENDIIKKISSLNYKDFFLQTLEERKLFFYPPFSEFAMLEYRHKDKQKALEYTKKLYEKLQQISQIQLSKKAINKDENPLSPPQIIFSENAFKKYNQYYYKIILKGAYLRKFLEPIQSEIFTERNLVVIFG